MESAYDKNRNYVLNLENATNHLFSYFTPEDFKAVILDIVLEWLMFPTEIENRDDKAFALEFIVGFLDDCKNINLV